MPRRVGEFFAEDYFDLSGGLNTSDSPFLVKPNECSDGYNGDFQTPGAVRKRGGHLQLNTTADAQLKTLGMGLWNKPAATRAPIRAAGTKLQYFDPAAYTFTNLYEDTVRTTLGTATITIAAPGVVTYVAHGLAITDPVQFTTSGALPTGLSINTTYFVKTVLTADTFTLAATAGGTVITTSGSQSGTHTLYKFPTAVLTTNSTQPVVFNMFNNTTSGVLWAAGGGASKIYGAYSSTRFTENGAAAPAGSISTSVGGSGGAFASTGYYRYAVAFYKASTGVIGNATLFKKANVTATTQTVTLTLSSITAFDTTKYTQLYIFRSSVSVGDPGDVEFTAGDLIATIASTTTSYGDTGTYISTSEPVPVADSLVLDNSQLPSGTFLSLTTMKRRLVTAYNSTVVFSDTNKSESWPTVQTISVPSGGSITALGVVGLSSPLSAEIDEALVVFKENECWVITGDGVIDDNDLPNWTLKFVSNAGSTGQAACVSAEGQLFWVNYKGFYSWAGTSKPVRISRKIYDKFQSQGDIDKSKLGQAFGFYSQKRGEAIWVLSSNAYGSNKYCLRLNLNESAPSSQNGVGLSEQDGVFMADILSYAMYGGMAFLAGATSTEETIYFGDDIGFISSGFTGQGEGTGTGNIVWYYYTPYLHFGQPNEAKKIHKVVAWVILKGHYNLGLDVWSDFKASPTTLVQIVNPNPAEGDGIWDVGLWDTMTWDSSTQKPVAVVFNPPPSQNNTEGDVFRIRFSESSATASPLLYGFTVYYSQIGLRK